MRKFIYSGCSFTGWHYPTWADIIAYDHITQGNVDIAYNFGRAGACNYYIQSSLFAAHTKLKITDNDYVGVGWSTPWRDSVFTTWDPFNKYHQDFPGWQTFGLFMGLEIMMLFIHRALPVKNDLYYSFALEGTPIYLAAIVYIFSLF